MKILLIGAGGTVGGAVHAALGSRHEVVTVGRNSGDLRADIADPISVDRVFEAAGTVDAIICAAGGTPFQPLSEASNDVFQAGFGDKLLGQINLVRSGIAHVSDGGSFTLITGILSQEPIASGIVASTVNGALESFVKTAATELPRGIRVNAVSPTVLTESLDKYAAFFPGFPSVAAAEVAQAFVRSVEGVRTGQIIEIHG